MQDNKYELEKKFDDIKALIQKIFDGFAQNSAEHSLIIQNMSQDLHNLANKIREAEKESHGLECRIRELEEAPTKAKARIINEFLKVLRNSIFVALAAGIVGFFIYLFMSFVRK
jgi:hypothetical protein